MLTWMERSNGIKDIQKMTTERKKVCLVGHSLVHARQQYLAKELAKTENVFVLSPCSWNSQFVEDTKLFSYELKGLEPTSNNIFTYTMNIEKDIMGFSPDIIFVMEEPFTMFSLLCAEIAEKHNIPFGFFTWENRADPKLNEYLARIERFVVNHSDFIICGNSGAVERMTKLARPETKIHNIPCPGVNTEVFSNKGVEKSVDLIYAGRFEPEKGCNHIEQAAMELGLDMLWVGSGSYTPNYGVKEGWIRYEDMPDFINKANISVQFPTTTPFWIEQFNSSALESLACEVPLVVSDSGSLPEILDGSGALFVKEGDFKGLKNTIKNLILDDEMRIRCGTVGRAFVERNYSTKVIAEKLRKVFDNVR